MGKKFFILEASKTLAFESHRAYKIEFNRFGGVIRELPIERSPFDYPTIQRSASTASEDTAELNEPDRLPQNRGRPSQLDLF